MLWPIPGPLRTRVFVPCTTRVGSSSPSLVTIQPRSVSFWQEGYIDMVETTESISEFRLPGIRLWSQTKQILGSQLPIAWSVNHMSLRPASDLDSTKWIRMDTHVSYASFFVFPLSVPSTRMATTFFPGFIGQPSTTILPTLPVRE